MNQYLEQLDLHLRRTFRDEIKCFSPGISREQQKLLTETLQPLYLPATLTSLYEWHNGAQDPAELIPGYTFLSLEAAIEEYQSLMGDTKKSLWNKLWFPIFKMETDYFFIELSSEAQHESPVYVSSNEENDIYLYYPSISDMLNCVCRCLKKSAYTYGENSYQVFDDREHSIRRELLPNTYPSINIEGKTRFSKLSNDQWPSRWLDRKPSKTKKSAAKSVMSIANFLQDAQASTGKVYLKGTTTRMMGTMGEAIFDLIDDSGSITISCPNTANGARDLQVNKTYRVQVVINERNESSYLEQLRGTRADAIAIELEAVK